MESLKYRHELKIRISPSCFGVLKKRLSEVMNIDKNAEKVGFYTIHSLYFDDIYDSALMDKVDGISHKEKFRIRYYNNDLNYIKLEKKRKLRGLCSKESERISQDECRRIISSDIEWMKTDERRLLNEFYVKIRTKLLKPKTIITYDRIPYVYNLGNVRITLDYNLRTSLHNTEVFLSSNVFRIPLHKEEFLLEVKYDDILPDFIERLIMFSNLTVISYSKYERGRRPGL